MILSALMAIAALAIEYLLIWVTKLLFEKPPFIVEIIDTYLPIEVIVIFVVSLIGFIGIMIKNRQGETKGQ